MLCALNKLYQMWALLRSNQRRKKEPASEGGTRAPQRGPGMPPPWVLGNSARASRVVTAELGLKGEAEDVDGQERLFRQREQLSRWEHSINRSLLSTCYVLRHLSESNLVQSLPSGSHMPEGRHQVIDYTPLLNCTCSAPLGATGFLFTQVPRGTGRDQAGKRGGPG